ncbi:MAG: imidazole glycerol phosphate synthase subunit HisF [Saprospiraceae bacterium]|jgi:cyclase|nr:imidazole glycerol phosphate synthase subunit HisF [Saprospiraceae bacterium]
MTLAKRIIPCLDIKNGRTVKGVNFVNLRDAGDPVELGKAYSEQGADELVFLDITATLEKRKTLSELAKKVASNLNIPFTIGGGISSIKDAETLLESGADKISINSAAYRNPSLIDEIAKRFGSQFLVIAIDAKKMENDWIVHLSGGKIPTSTTLLDWSREVTQRGAGEILFTSMNHDGTKGGFACEIMAKVSQSVSIPIIASGGAGSSEDFYDVFTKGKADAGLAASIFHFGEIGIADLKGYLKEKGISVRI